MTAGEHLFDACVPVTPPMDEAALKAIPAKRGIFALLDEHDQVIIVTTAADIRSRLRYRLTDPADQQRRKAADLREITAKVCYLLTYSRFQTDWRYMETVRTIWPDTYGDVLPKRTAWFVSVDPEAPFPCFAVVGGPRDRGRQFGPFGDRRTAEAYVDALTDAFDLCRCPSILRQTPHGIACPYKQMGRCDAPCDGSSSIEQYRELIGRAIQRVAGDASDQRDRLSCEMKEASAAMRFEQAAVGKSRLDRLAELADSRYAHVGDALEFRFVIIQPGPSSHQACTFVCDGGEIAAGPVVEFPPTPEQMAEVLAACDRLADGRQCHDAQMWPWRMGLVAWYLFSTKKADGLILHRSALTAETACDRLTDAAGALGLRAPAKRGRRKAADAGDAGGKSQEVCDATESE